MRFVGSEQGPPVISALSLAPTQTSVILRFWPAPIQTSVIAKLSPAPTQTSVIAKLSPAPTQTSVIAKLSPAPTQTSVISTEGGALCRRSGETPAFRLFLRAVHGLLALAILPNSGRSQSAAPTLKVYSRETIVDVTVTDSKGNPVHGLTRDDFTVKEDNKPQSIRSFAEYDSNPVAAPPKLPSNIYTNLQPPPASSAVNVLLLDFVNTAADVDHTVMAQPQLRILSEAIEAQNHIKSYATKFLSAMPTGTRASIIGMSWPSSARILQGITSDPALLAAAVNTFPESTQDGVTRYEQYCAQQETRNRMTLEVLDQLSVDLASVKGRKNLIWFTVGSPSITDPNARLPCLPDYAVDLTRTYARLTAAEVVLYPIDARGVATPPPDCIIAPGCPMTFFNKTGDQKLSLEAFAEATGGTAFYNSNDLATGIAKAVANGSDFYSLSYSPPGQKYDGRHHTIKVEVDQPNLHLVYRQSYNAEDPSIFKPTPGLTLAIAPSPSSGPVDIRVAMSRNLPTSQDILFDLQVEPSTAAPKPSDPPVLGLLDPKYKDKHLTRYAFQYAIPARQFAFTTGPDNTHHGSVELDIAAFDADGKLVTALSQTVTMPLSDARYQQFIQGPFHFAQQLDLPPGQLFLRIGVFDHTSNKAGTLEIPLTVPTK